MSQSEVVDNFMSWLLDAPLDLSVYWKHQDNQWFCMFEDYDITGVGADERSSYRDAVGLLGAYLCSCFVDGLTVDQARRPVPWKLKLEIRRDLLIGGILSRLSNEPGDHEGRTVILPEQLAFNDRVVLGTC